MKATHNPWGHWGRFVTPSMVDPAAGEPPAPMTVRQATAEELAEMEATFMREHPDRVAARARLAAGEDPAVVAADTGLTAAQVAALGRTAPQSSQTAEDAYWAAVGAGTVDPQDDDALTAFVRAWNAAHGIERAVKHPGEQGAALQAAQEASRVAREARLEHEAREAHARAVEAAARAATADVAPGSLRWRHYGYMSDDEWHGVVVACPLCGAWDVQAGGAWDTAWECRADCGSCGLFLWITAAMLRPEPDRGDVPPPDPVDADPPPTPGDVWRAPAASPGASTWSPDEDRDRLEVRRLIDQMRACDGCRVDWPLRALVVLSWPHDEHLVLCPDCRARVAQA